MHPLLARPRRLLVYLALCLLVAVGLAGLIQAQLPVAVPAASAAEQLAPRLGAALLLTAPLCLVYAFVALSAYYLCRSQPLAQRRWWSAISVFGAATLLSGGVWLGLAWLWNGLWQLADGGAPLVTMSGQAWAWFYATGCGLYLLSLLAHDVLVAVETARETSAREADARLLAREAELRLLRAQIDPHFLFNSLNSISALTTLDPGQAREMAIDLAQFFRLSLALSERESVPLAEELALCRHFVAIEQRRFGDKLRVLWPDDAGPELEPAAPHTALGALLPPMLLQPLLENAIKHGIRSLDQGGTIIVAAVRRADWLHLRVSNPVAAEASRERGLGLGLGLQNIRQRLAVIYADQARIVARRQGGQFEVEISLPYPSSN